MAQSFLRRLRRGRPIIVVSGLPRSGTSMAMRMLEAGGLPVVTDGRRTADDDNPKGYYEFEPVKDLDKPGDHAWLAGRKGCRGRGVPAQRRLAGEIACKAEVLGKGAAHGVFDEQVGRSADMQCVAHIRVPPGLRPGLRAGRAACKLASARTQA